MTIAYTLIESTLGPLYAAETGQGLVFITMGEDGLFQLTQFVGRWMPGEQIVPSIVDSIYQIQEYLAGSRREFDLDLELYGTDFQKEVWQALRKIPYGETWTYNQVAKCIGREKAARAVGQACGANPVPLVVPCHRVLSCNGTLGGFSSGLERKKILLDLERASL